MPTPLKAKSKKLDIFNQINEVELKIRQSAKRLERLKATNRALEKENVTLRAQVADYKDIIEVFIDKLEQLQHQFVVEQPGWNQKGKMAGVQQYAKEVERCIVWLKEQQMWED